MKMTTANSFGIGSPSPPKGILMPLRWYAPTIAEIPNAHANRFRSVSNLKISPWCPGVSALTNNYAKSQSRSVPTICALRAGSSTYKQLQDSGSEPVSRRALFFLRKYAMLKEELSSASGIGHDRFDNLIFHKYVSVPIDIAIC
jgi:hypothetical protein